MTFAKLQQIIRGREAWASRRLKFRLVRNDGGVWGDAYDDAGTVVLRSTEVAVDGSWKVADPAIRRLSADERKNALLIEGDLLVVKSSGSADHLGKTAIVDLAVAALNPAFSNFMQRLRLKRTEDPRYYFYVLNSVVSREYLGCLGSTTTGLRNLSGGLLGELLTPGPPPSLQRDIADFLDRKTAAIDDLIRRKERLIELLEERRLAIITRAVTKGMSPNTPMRNSGIGWLGPVPGHWQVSPLYSTYEVKLGKMLNSRAITGDDLAPYLRNADVQWGRINSESLPEMDFSGDSARYRLRAGDLLVCEGGEVGRSAIWLGQLEPCYYQKALHRLRPRARGQIPQYMYYALLVAAKRGAFEEGGGHSTIAHLPAEKLRRHRFPNPPIAEQHAIVKHIAAAEPATLRAFETTTRSIARLHEYRQAVIAATVTGKLDIAASVAS
jgi:type I restriction enzyme, S subunit